MGTDLHREIGTMAALTFGDAGTPEPASTRSTLLRILDTLAAWQMRHSYCRISRGHALKATMTGVNQPSSTNERSSIMPCDR